MKKYFIHTGKEQLGPFDLDELKGKGITEDTPLWYDGLNDWTTAGKVKELKGLFIPEVPVSPDVYRPVEPPSQTPETVVQLSAQKKKLYITLALVVLALIILDVFARMYENKQEQKEGNTLMLQMRADSVLEAFTARNTMLTDRKLSLQFREDALNQFKNGTQEQNLALADTIFGNPDMYTPDVLFPASVEFFKSTRKNGGYYWFILAELHLAYDVSRNADTNVRQIARQLTSEYLNELTRAPGFSIDSFKMEIPEAIEFERDNRERYDPRWINFSVMEPAEIAKDTTGNAIQFSKPEKEWDEIRDSTISEFNGDLTGESNKE